MVWAGGAVDALTDEVTRRGYHKALIVTDKTLVQCGVVDKVTSRMDAAGAGVGDLCGRAP
ncbi:L-1,2-propanediol oxidoreductase [Salmonella enterica subsp. arizonae]|uniref:L-1,2-propanediol oxidoreductase n=1 Tax=Salmonella enterica subsp. arizonae TaxID=59203 RepID=A0A379T5Z2_SALER|nr:L-1,2-propanediol oxidoreductase [Salmonella enterica subsp. arizonae]